MPNSRNLLLLFSALAFVITAAWLDHHRAATVAKLVTFGDVSNIEITLPKASARVTKETGKWSLQMFDNRPAIDSRANSNLINHLIDLANVLSRTSTSPLQSEDADQYGMKEPVLRAVFEWQTPSPGREEVVFGHRDLSGKRVFAFFPQRPLLVEVPASTVILFENREALDLRDRRVTTFEPDDVEDLNTLGKCSHFKLARDGDRWVRAGHELNPQTVESWLAQLLNTQHAGLEAAGSAADTPDANPVCAIELRGRKGRTESIAVFKALGTLWAKNTALPALYRLPEGFLSRLTPPSAGSRH